MNTMAQTHGNIIVFGQALKLICICQLVDTMTQLLDSIWGAHVESFDYIKFLFNNCWIWEGELHELRMPSLLPMTFETRCSKFAIEAQVQDR
jgi:hypothetical protein